MTIKQASEILSVGIGVIVAGFFFSQWSFKFCLLCGRCKNLPIVGYDSFIPQIISSKSIRSMAMVLIKNKSKNAC